MLNSEITIIDDDNNNIVKVNSVISTTPCSPQPQMPCGHPCGEPCHPGKCPNIGKCERKVTLRCKCRRQRVEVICKDKTEDLRPQCDDVCKAKKKVSNRIQLYSLLGSGLGRSTKSKCCGSIPSRSIEFFWSHSFHKWLPHKQNT